MISKKGTKLHFKSPTAERRHVLCVGVGGDRTHASRPGGAGYARLSPTRLGGTWYISDIYHTLSYVRYIPVIYPHFNISTGSHDVLVSDPNITTNSIVI